LLRIGRVPHVSEWQVHVYTLVNWVGLIVISLIALSWLWTITRSARRERRSRPNNPGNERVPPTAPDA
jgi:4-amino-4-deoxy-L-arabinose transferase-like glycosyltransferase